jgi:hypothetical protein
LYIERRQDDVGYEYAVVAVYFPFRANCCDELGLTTYEPLICTK